MNNNSRPLRPAVEYLTGGVIRELTAAGLRTTAHPPGDNCVNHCHSHHVDETATAYQWCGECYHAFPTARALRRDHRRAAARIYLSELRHPTVFPNDLTDAYNADTDPFGPFEYQLPRRVRAAALSDLLRLPLTRTRDITFCPHCIHDL